MIELTINDVPVSVPEHTSVLEAAKKVNVHIPTLCNMHLDDKNYINDCASCRVCMVEMVGGKNGGLIPACETYCTPGMQIYTSTPKAVKARRTVVELLLSDHPNDCLNCLKSTNCELQAVAAEMGIRKLTYTGEQSTYEPDYSSVAFIRDMDKCIMCRRCESVCTNIQTVGAYSAINRGFDAVVSTAFGTGVADTECVSCGQCVSVCPVGALIERDESDHVLDDLANPDKYVVVQTAPAVRAALGEEFGIAPGTSVTGKMVAALRRVGFDKVLDTDFAADLTIIEEANELIERVTNGGPLPIMTSCCPAWVNFYESQFPDMLQYPSTCKSPHEMQGAMIKSYLAQKLGIDPKKMVVVSIMPCLAKKYEATRPELSNDGMQNVDYVLSTRELARLIKKCGIDFAALPDEDFDSPMGESTGAAVIFGVTGGVIEAAARTAYCWLTNEEPADVNFTALRGMDGIRTATLKVGDLDLKLAIANGLGNARKLMEMIRNGEESFHAVEVMACPSGCINGAGQPYRNDDFSKVAKRAEATYDEDERKAIRLSHKNPEIIKIYEEFLGEKGGHLSHEYLHTTYKPKGSFNE